MTPKISVLIPLYNRKQYAADCLNSVLNQTFQDYEIIIRDDFSNDGVFEFVRENFSDNRIKLFRNKKNLGEAENLNLLFQDAAGKYFTQACANVPVPMPSTKISPPPVSTGAASA